MAPAPTPPPEPALPPPPFAEGLILTDAARRSIAPRHGFDLVAPRPLDPKADYAAARKAVAAMAPALEKGRALVTSAENATRTRAVEAAYASPTPPTTLDLETEAAAFALVAPRTEYKGNAHDAELVRHWVGAAGLEFALRAFVLGCSLETRSTRNQSYELDAIALAPQPKDAGVWWRGLPLNTWRVLRNGLLLVSEEERARLLAVVAELREKATPHAAINLALTIEDGAWARAYLGAHTGRTPEVAWPLLLLAPESVDELAPMTARLSTSPWEVGPKLVELGCDLAAIHGTALAPFLIERVREAATGGADTVRLLAATLTVLVTSEVARFFVESLATKDLRAVAAEFVAAHPEVSVAPLAVAATTRGAAAEPAKTLLRRVVVTAPAVAQAVLPSLTAAPRAAVEAQLADAAEREEATPAELPPVLAAPPWTLAKKLAPPLVVKGLTPEPNPEAMAWRPGEREDLAATGSMRVYPDRRDEFLANIAEANAEETNPSRRSWNRTQGSLFTHLPDADAIAAFNTARMEAFGWSYSNIPAILVARHGVAVLPGWLNYARLDMPVAVAAAERIDSPRVAPVMAEAFVRLKKCRAQAAEWLLSFPDAAIAGLLPSSVGEPGSARAHAEAALRLLSARGHRPRIEAAAARRGPEVVAAMTAVLDFDPLLVLPKRMPALPAFFVAAALPRPLLVGRTKALPLSAVEALGTMLAFTSYEEPYPGLAVVKETCDPRSLADFAWDLFQSFLAAGAPSKEAWAMLAMGILGDDDCARKLTPLIRMWPGEGGHARAVTGLDVLARIGTDVALMHLHGIAQKVKFKGLQEKAREKIDQIAQARGLSAEELADRLVPDLGLEDDGTLVLDFGPRQFKVVFDESLKPSVVELASGGEPASTGPTGKKATDLPKPRQTDDSEKATAATEIWKALKKDAKTIAQGQILRLELAMCGQRRWTTEVFNTFLLGHPLLIHVVRRLVWGVYSADGTLAQSFRVSEDGSLADANDDTYTLPADASLGIAHRLELGDALTDTWGQILADYEILQPFEQLGRSIFAPTADERAGTELSRVVGLKLPTGKVLGLDNRGWRRGPPQDGGVVCWYEKPVQVAGKEMVVTLDLADGGIYTGSIADSPEQKLGVVTVGPDGGGWQKEHRTTFGALHPVAFSELVRDLESLRS